jgi:hypothetical protein
MDATASLSSGTYSMIAQLLYTSCGAVCRKDHQSFEMQDSPKGVKRMLHPPGLLLTG